MFPKKLWVVMYLQLLLGPNPVQSDTDTFVYPHPHTVASFKYKSERQPFS